MLSCTSKILGNWNFSKCWFWYVECMWEWNEIRTEERKEEKRSQILFSLVIFFNCFAVQLISYFNFLHKLLNTRCLVSSSISHVLKNSPSQYSMDYPKIYILTSTLLIPISYFIFLLQWTLEFVRISSPVITVPCSSLTQIKIQPHIPALPAYLPTSSRDIH